MKHVASEVFQIVLYIFLLESHPNLSNCITNVSYISMKLCYWRYRGINLRGKYSEYSVVSFIIFFFFSLFLTVVTLYQTKQILVSIYCSRDFSVFTCESDLSENLLNIFLWFLTASFQVVNKNGETAFEVDFKNKRTSFTVSETVEILFKKLLGKFWCLFLLHKSSKNLIKRLKFMNLFKTMF